MDNAETCSPDYRVVVAAAVPAYRHPPSELEYRVHRFNPGTTLGRIKALGSVLGEMEPGLVSDLVHTGFMLNPTLGAVLIHLNSADVTSLLAGILPQFQSRRSRPRERNPPVGPGGCGLLDWRGCGPLCGFPKHQAEPLGDDTLCLWKCPNWSQGTCIAGLRYGHISRSEFGNPLQTCLCGCGGGHYHPISHGGENCGTTEAMSVAMGRGRRPTHSWCIALRVHL